jgi:hypothetical protein
MPGTTDQPPLVMWWLHCDGLPGQGRSGVGFLRCSRDAGLSSLPVSF